ncbi:hypothetical protein D9M68_623370 [compost metagenome]
MDHACHIRTCRVHGGVDVESRTVDAVAIKAWIDQIAVVVHLDQIRGAHLMEQHTVSVNQEVSWLTRHACRYVSVNMVSPAEVCDQPIERRQFAPCPPFFRSNSGWVDVAGYVVHGSTLALISAARPRYGLDTADAVGGAPWSLDTDFLQSCHGCWASTARLCTTQSKTCRGICSLCQAICSRH